MGLTLPVTLHLITQPDTILKMYTYHQIMISPRPVQHSQRGFDQQQPRKARGYTGQGHHRNGEGGRKDRQRQDGTEMSHDGTETVGCIHCCHPKLKQHHNLLSLTWEINLFSPLTIKSIGSFCLHEILFHLNWKWVLWDAPLVLFGYYRFQTQWMNAVKHWSWKTTAAMIY